MLTIHINTSVEGLVGYFTNSLAKDDYFFSGKSIDGRWHGTIKSELGLPDKVSRKAFSALAHNRHPVTGEKLTPRNAANRRTSIEYTFSAPKSVSLIMALSDENQGREILNAHRRAVKQAMVEIERDMQTQVTREGRNVYANAGNIIYARFDHFSSRPVDLGKDVETRFVSDPNLHSHCVVMNVCRYNGRYRAIEGSTIHRVAGYYEALYHASLSKGLQDLGYRVERTPKRWEITTPGMTRRTLEKFSRRTMEIEAKAKELGITNAKAKGELGAKIRLAKSKVKERVDLKSVWRKRLTDREATAIKNSKTNRTVSTNPITLERAVSMALAHHLERKSTVPTKTLLAKAMSLGYGKLSVEKIKTHLEKRPEILTSKRGYLEYLTTREMVQAEDRMIDFATSTKATLAPIYPSYILQRGFLNDQQRGAIRQILQSTDRVQILSGAAGVGKSTLLVEIKTAVEQRGHQIHAFAPSSGAARDVLRSKGFKEADTIAKFLRSKELQARTKNQTILIDEASLVGVKTMNAILGVAKKQNARVILSGDPRQHSSPEAGDAMRLLQEKAKLKVASVDTILRQKNNPALRQAIEDLAAGKTKQGFDRLDETGAVLEIPDMAQRHQRLAADYAQSIARGRSALVISPTHNEGAIITEVIREKMKADGRISHTERSFTIQKGLAFTDAQKKDMAMYEPGMVIQFHQNAKGGFKAGNRYVVTDKDKSGRVLVKDNGTPSDQTIALPMEMQERFQVFETGTLSLAAGDKIRITKNGRSLDGKRVHNGQTFRVTGFNKFGEIQLTGGKVLDKDFGNLAYGYVQTSHAVQGKDAQDTYVIQSEMSLGATNEKQLYVSASRARERLMIYTDDKAALRRAIDKSGNRMSARDIADRAAQRKAKIRARNRNYSISQNLTQDARQDRSPQRSVHQGRSPTQPDVETTYE